MVTGIIWRKCAADTVFLSRRSDWLKMRRGEGERSQLRYNQNSATTFIRGPVSKYLPYPFRNSLLLVCGEIGIHRQRHDLLCEALGNWEVTLLVSKVDIRILKMERNRVVNAGPDMIFGQFRHEIVPVLSPNYIEVIDRFCPRCSSGQDG